jgi:SAM-dependent methyltransferase
VRLPLPPDVRSFSERRSLGRRAGVGYRFWQVPIETLPLPAGLIDNPVRGRLNAIFFDALEGYMHWKYSALKGPLFASTPQIVVEIGPGAGANLRYLTPGTRLIAIEPNKHFHPILRKRAAEFGVQLDLRGLAGEALDLPSESVDFVFSSLVLCSVEDPAGVIAEVKRVLRPNGRFVCIEHVAAPEGSAIAKLQVAIKGPWRWIFEGCDLCRHTDDTLSAAGFSEVNIQPTVLPTVFVPIRHQIIADCRK